MEKFTLIERIDEHIETGKSAGEWAEVNNAELVLLLTDIRAALSHPAHSFREGEVVLMKISELDEEVYCEYKSDPLIQRECRHLTQQEVGPNWVPKEPVKALRAWVDWVAAQGSLLERQRAPYEDVLRAAPLRLAAFDAAVGDES